MRRVLIFLLILAIPIGLISGTSKAIDALQDDVQITEQTLYGDKRKVSGRQLQLMTTLNEHVWWLTDYTTGEPGVAQTQFLFSQKGREDETNWGVEGFYMYTSHGFCMSTSGGEGFQFPNEGIGPVFQAVADRTQPGESRSEEVLLEEYMDTYPIDFSCSIVTQRYFIENHYNSMHTFQDGEDADEYRQWTQLFRFPLLPGQKAMIDLFKDTDGEVRDVNFSLIDGANAAFITYSQNEGMYFSPSFQTWDNQPITTGEFVKGYGLYYIPFCPAEGIDLALTEENERVDGTFDFENLELIYSLEPGESLVAMEANADESCLQMLTREDGVYCYCVLDLTTRKITHRVPITQDDGQGCEYRFFQKQKLLYLKLADCAALVDISETPKVEFVAPWPAEVAVCMPEDVIYKHGVLYLTALDWADSQQIFYLAAINETGLGYCGYYYSSLKRHNASGGNGYVSMDKIAFLE